MSEVLLGGIVAVITSTISSIVAWTLSKKKYYSEVKTNEIENLKNSVLMYKQMADDSMKRTENLDKKVEEYRVEVYRLQGTINKLLNAVCKDTLCLHRVFLTKEEIKEVIESYDSDTKED